MKQKRNWQGGSAVVLIAVSAALAGAAPLKHESAYLVTRIGAPLPSPDGRWIAFTRTEPAYDPKQQVSGLFLMPAGGGEPRRLGAAPSALEWSPDSRRIAVVAVRKDHPAPQVYILDIAGGGDFLRATAHPAGVSSPKWSPDGGSLLFVARVDPRARDEEEARKLAAESKARKYKALVYEFSPVRWTDKWLDETQPRLFVQSLEPGATHRDVLAGTRLVASPGYAGGETMSGRVLRGIWSPDSRSIVFAAMVNMDQASYAPITSHLFEVPASGGEPRQVSTGEACHHSPVFSPDGRALYCLTQRRGWSFYADPKVTRFDWPGRSGPGVVVTAELDRPVFTFALTPDSRTLYFVADEHGQEKIFRVSSKGGSVTPVSKNPEGAYTNLAIPASAAGPVLIANWQSMVHPAQIVLFDPASGGSHRLLTNAGVEQVRDLKLTPPRHFWFTSKAGKRIHNLLIVPPGFDERMKYPLITLIHGGPNHAWRDRFRASWDSQLIASHGYVLVLTNYTGSTGFGEEFALGVEGDPLRGAALEIDQAVDEAIRRFPFIDGSRLAAGGASYGGMLTAWLNGTTRRYRCMFDSVGPFNQESFWGSTDVNFYREKYYRGLPWEPKSLYRVQSPMRLAADFRTPMLLLAGERDFRVPLHQTLEHWAALRRLRIPSRLVVFPEMAHWPGTAEDDRYFFKEILDWLARYLGPDARAPR